MKKILFLFIILLIPFIVMGKECDSNNISIISMEQNGINGEVIEISDPSFHGTTIGLNIKMFNLNDSISYKFVIKNSSDDDYMIDDESFKSDSQYLEYTLSSEDGTNVVKANSTKEMVLGVTYKSEIDESEFSHGKFNASNNLTLALNTGEKEHSMNTISTNDVKNPNTRVNSLIVLSAILLVATIILILRINKIIDLKIFIIILCISSIPVVYAICKTEIEIESNIIIEKKKVIGGTLMASDDRWTSSNYLRTSIQKSKIEKITFSNSKNGHTTEEENCWDVSKEANGSVIAWAVDSDDDGLYELTIASDGYIAASTGKYLFYALYYLEEIENMKYLDTSNVTSMAFMFSICQTLKTIDVSTFDTSKVTDMNGMFSLNTNDSNRNNLTEIIGLEYFDTSNVTNMAYMFNYCKKLESLDLSSWDTSNVTNMSNMFYANMSLQSLNVSNWDTSNVTNMGSMFFGLFEVEELDVSGWDTSNVTNMTHMFLFNRSIKSLDLSGWDTSNVTNMAQMFAGCGSLESLILTDWNTSNVNNMERMFSDCYKLQSLDLSSFDTSNVSNMGGIFGGCKSLKTLNVSSFDTSNVSKFYANGYIYQHINLSTGGYGTFYGCSSLTTLDLSSWNTKKSTDLTQMFYYTTNLKTIYASEDFDVSNVSSSNDMFYNDTKLVGGAGTTYNSSKTDKEYAHIDGGASNPGYFTSR